MESNRKIVQGLNIIETIQFATESPVTVDPTSRVVKISDTTTSTVNLPVPEAQYGKILTIYNGGTGNATVSDRGTTVATIATTKKGVVFSNGVEWIPIYIQA